MKNEISLCDMKCGIRQMKCAVRVVVSLRDGFIMMCALLHATVHRIPSPQKMNYFHLTNEVF